MDRNNRVPNISRTGEIIRVIRPAASVSPMTTSTRKAPAAPARVREGWHTGPRGSRSRDRLSVVFRPIETWTMHSSPYYPAWPRSSGLRHKTLQVWRPGFPCRRGSPFLLWPNPPKPSVISRLRNLLPGGCRRLSARSQCRGCHRHEALQ